MKCVALLVILGVLAVECRNLRQVEVPEDCPSACDMIYAPVCGSDYHTYSSSCVLQLHACQTHTKITVLYDGECFRLVNLGTLG